MAASSLSEIGATSAVGAILGGVAGSFLGVMPAGAAVGGLNGALSGARGIYEWRSPRGLGAFVLDSTWALGTTAAGLVAQGLGELRGNAGYVAELSHRQNRHVYRRGFQPRKGFAVTLGNSIFGAGDVGRPRRVKLVNDHENVHVWQARWFGPLYPVAYLGWMVGGAVVGVAIWATGASSEKLSRLVESCAYYLNPFEWWAYSRDDHWPPKALIPELAWKRPIVSRFGSTA